MAVGLGAIWRVPMVAAQNGGATFILAFVIITVVIAIPGGWAEIGLGRWARGGTVKAYGALLGKPGKGIGAVIAIVPLLLNMYYLILVGRVLAYFVLSFPGSYYAAPVEYFKSFEANKTVSFILTAVVTGFTAFVCLGGVRKGI